MTHHDHGPDGAVPAPPARSNIVATYNSIDAAREAADKLRAAGVEPARIEFDDRGDDTATAAAEQREERDDLRPGPVLMATRPMMKGGSAGVASGVLVAGGAGLVLALVLGVAGVVDVMIGVMIVIGLAVAGAVAGAVIGAGTLAQRKQFQDMTPEHRIGVVVGDGEADTIESILRQTGPARIDRFNEQGKPRPD